MYRVKLISISDPFNHSAH